MENSQPNIEGVVSRVVEAVTAQAGLHVELVKAEVTRDASAFGRAVTPLVLGLPLLLVGYLFLCVAATVALVPWIGLAGGAALVGVLNLLVGSIGVRLSLTRLAWGRAQALEAAHAD